MYIIRNKILQLRKDISLPWETWAAESHRTLETLKKQTAENANPTLSTLIELVAPLRATIEVVTDEERARYASVTVLENRIEGLEKRIRAYEQAAASSAELNARNAEIIQEQQDTIAKQKMRLDKLMDKLDKMDERLERKDELIRKLLIEKGVIE